MRPDSSKRRIGLLVPEMATHGGVQSFMQRISDVIGDLAKENPAVHGYCLSLNDSTDALCQHSAIPANIHRWGAAGSKRKLIAHALTKMPRTDVLFVGHLGAGPLAYLMKRIGRVRNYHVILHGIEAWEPVASLDRRALMGATRIIATTNFTAQECARHNAIPADRFEVIPLCADERQVNPSPTFRLNGGFKLLCVARQAASERYKGFEHVFEALSRLRTAHPQVHFNLVGDGDDQPRLKAVANEMNVEDSVTFWGRLADAELAAAYQQCDAFVMPSSREGFGIVFLEAMRHAKPCIGGNHGGTPEVIEHGQNGYLVEYGNIDLLVDHIRSLVTNNDLQKSMGEAGNHAVKDNFSVKHFKISYRRLMR